MVQKLILTLRHLNTYSLSVTGWKGQGHKVKLFVWISYACELEGLYLFVHDFFLGIILLL